MNEVIAGVEIPELLKIELIAPGAHWRLSLSDIAVGAVLGKAAGLGLGHRPRFA
jgi:hypothetical protein